MGEATPDRQPNRSSPNDIRREFVSFLFDFVLCALCFFFFITISLSNQRNLSSTHLWRDITVPALLYICTFVHTWYVHMYVHVHIPRSYRESEHSEVECRMSGEVFIVHCPLSTVHSDCKKLSKKKNEYKLMLFFFIVIQIVLCRNYNYIIRCLQRGGNFPIASVQTSRTHTPTKTWPTCNTTTHTHTHTHMHRYIVDIRLYAIRSEWSYKKKKTDARSKKVRIRN